MKRNAEVYCLNMKQHMRIRRQKIGDDTVASKQIVQYIERKSRSSPGSVSSPLVLLKIAVALSIMYGEQYASCKNHLSTKDHFSKLATHHLSRGQNHKKTVFKSAEI